MQKLISNLTRAVGALFICSWLLTATGCAMTRSMPADFDVAGWLNAVADGDTDAVKAGLNRGVPPGTRRVDGLSALQIAVRQGHLDTAETLIETGAAVNDAGPSGLPPLFYAIYRDDAGMVAMLLRAGARLEGRNGYGTDPLTLAMNRRDMQVLTELARADSAAAKKIRQWLDRQGAETVAASGQGGAFLALKGMLDLAGAKDRQSALEAEQILKFVEGLGGDGEVEARYALMKAYSDRNSPLFDLSGAERLVSNYYYSRDKAAAAFFAKRAESGSEPLAAFLHGRALRCSNSNREESGARGSRLILESAKAGNIFAQGDLGEKYDDYFPDTPHEAAAREKIAWLKRAAEAGLPEAAYNLAYMYVHNYWAPRDLEKALHWFNRAGELGDCYVYRRIAYNFQQGNEHFPVDQKQAVEWYRKGARCGDAQAMTTLAEAYEEGKMGLTVDLLPAVSYYLAAGRHDEKVVALASRGLTRAVHQGDPELVRQWLAVLPSYSPAPLDGWLAVAESDKPALVEQFLKAGLDVNDMYRDRTALMIAALFGNQRMIVLLLKQGAEINRENSFGGTALSLAAGRGHTDVVRLLLEKGAAVNGATGFLTPLAMAVRGGHHDVVRLLLDKGATMPGVDFPEGKKLLAFTRRNDDRIMERLLLDAQPAHVSAATREEALNRLAQREETVLKNEKWLAGKLMVRRDNRGKPLSSQEGTYPEKPWRCVSDGMSGLSWLVKDDAGGLHDKDMLFPLSGERAGWCRPGDCDVLAYRDRARTDRVCGKSDWRVPTVAELKSLAYPHLAADFPYWPGFMQWARLEKNGDLVLVHASGLFGRSTAAIAFNAAGQLLLVRGRLQPLPREAEANFTIIGISGEAK